MNGLSVRQSANEFLASIDAFTRRDMNRAASMALNRTVNGMRVDASREIRARYKVKVATVNKAFSFQRATPDSLTAVVRVRGRPLSLAGFGARQTKAGVSVNVKGTRKLIRHAFIRTLRTNKGDEYDVVFVRQGKARYPIQALKTIDIPGLFILKDINDTVKRLGRARFEDELRSAVRAIQARG